MTTEFPLSGLTITMCLLFISLFRIPCIRKVACDGLYELTVSYVSTISGALNSFRSILIVRRMKCSCGRVVTASWL